MAATVKFYLPDLPVLVLNLPSRPDRAAHVRRGLASTGLPNVTFIPALSGQGPAAGATGYGAICEAFAARENFVPGIILEDDVSPTAHFQQLIQVPADADAVYLGLSNCSISPDRDMFQTGAVWRETKLPDIVQLLNMLSSHALLLCSRRYAVFMAKAMSYAAAKNMHYDIPVARRMHRFNVYAPRAPFFYQDAQVGGNEGATRVVLSQIKRLDFVQAEPPDWRLFGAYDTL